MVLFEQQVRLVRSLVTLVLELQRLLLNVALLPSVSRGQVGQGRWRGPPSRLPRGLRALRDRAFDAFGLIVCPLVRGLRLQAGGLGLEQQRLVDGCSRAQRSNGRERGKNSRGERYPAEEG